MKKIFISIAIIFALVVPAYAATLPTLSACSSFAATDIFLARHASDTSDCKSTGTQLKAGLSLNNVENTALSTWAGTSNITTLGTIATGSWDGTDIPVTAGGTGRSTSTTAYGLLAAGTTATGAHQTLSAGATTDILVGGGASALPVWTTAQGSGAPVRATSPTLTTPNIGAATATTIATGTTTVTSSSASALAVGPTGATNPVLKVNGSTGFTSGIEVLPVSDGEVSVNAIGASSDIKFKINVKGNNRFSLSSQNLTISDDRFTTQSFSGSGSGGPVWQFSFGGNSGSSATANDPIMKILEANTRTSSAGTRALQTQVQLTQTSLAAASASTTTQAASFSVDGAPLGGSNITLTNASAIHVPTKALTNTTNGYGLWVEAPSAATRNYSAFLSGQVVHGNTAPSTAGGTGAGTSPTISATGNSNGGLLSVTTGTGSPATSAVIVTVTYANACPNDSAVVISPANQTTAILTQAATPFSDGTTTTFTLNSGTTALATSTAYAWNYQVTCF